MVCFSDAVRVIDTMPNIHTAEKDPQRTYAMRMRTALAPILALGFLQKAGKGKNTLYSISPSGEALIEANQSGVERLMILALLAWKPKGVTISPFVTMLYILRAMAVGNQPFGSLTSGEIAAFLLPLQTEEDIPPAIENLLRHRRKKKAIEPLLYKVAKDFGQKSVQNLYDYTDVLLRYFSTTGIFSVLKGKDGKSFHGKRISVKRRTESQMVLSAYTIRGLISHLQMDVELPWENVESLQKVAEELLPIARSHNLNLDSALWKNLLTPNTSTSFDVFSHHIEDLKRDIRAVVFSRKGKISQKQITSSVYTGISSLLDHGITPNVEGNISSFVAFEWEWARFMMSMDGTTTASPNLIFDDNNQPLSHAPGGKADGHYVSNAHVLSTELTLLAGAQQDKSESGAVHRHALELFQTENADKSRKEMVLFLCKTIHVDTLARFFYNATNTWSDSVVATLALEKEHILTILAAVAAAKNPVTFDYFCNFLQNVWSDILGQESIIRGGEPVGQYRLVLGAALKRNLPLI